MILDISPALSPRVAVWPGDTAYSRTENLSIAAGANIDLSEIRTTVHVGAHADAPSHYVGGGATIEQRPLERYLGPCQVVEVSVQRGARVVPGDVRVPIEAPRVLFRTATFPDYTHWNSDFAGLDPALVDALADRGVTLIGVDTPSVDVQESKDLPAHRRFLARDVSILEGLRLAHVAPGAYELIALPLPLVGFDASPVRAVLRCLP